MRGLLVRVWRLPDRWLDDTDGFNAESVGVFRVLYGLFALWYWSFLSTELAQVPGLPARVWGLRLVPGVDVQLVESILVGALVLVTVGLWTRAATAVTLVCGLVLGAHWTTFDHEHAVAVLVAYIPGVMLLFDGWGDRYSLDRRLGRVPDPSDVDRTRWALGPKVLLVVVSLLFLSAGVSKVVLGTWWTNADEMAVIIQSNDVKAAVHGAPANPFSAWMTDTPIVHQSLRILVPLGEMLFCLALLGRPWRYLVVGVALVFHGFNALFFAVTFSQMAVVYAAWIDWRPALAALPSPPSSRWRPSPRVAAGAAVVGAVVVGAAWNTLPVVRDALNLWGLVDQRTIWWVLTPLGAVVAVTGARALGAGHAQPQSVHSA